MDLDEGGQGCNDELGIRITEFNHTRLAEHRGGPADLGDDYSETLSDFLSGCVSVMVQGDAVVGLTNP